MKQQNPSKKLSDLRDLAKQQQLLTALPDNLKKLIFEPKLSMTCLAANCFETRELPDSVF